VTIFTSPLRTAGGCWLSDRMNRKMILLTGHDPTLGDRVGSIVADE
jgi:hypothetical protein